MKSLHLTVMIASTVFLISSCFQASTNTDTTVTSNEFTQAYFQLVENELNQSHSLISILMTDGALFKKSKIDNVNFNLHFDIKAYKAAYLLALEEAQKSSDEELVTQVEKLHTQHNAFKENAFELDKLIRYNAYKLDRFYRCENYALNCLKDIRIIQEQIDEWQGDTAIAVNLN